MMPRTSLVNSLVVLLLIVLTATASLIFAERAGIAVQDFNMRDFPFAACNLRAIVFKSKNMSPIELAFGNNLRITENGNWLLAKNKNLRVEAQITNSAITAIAAHYHHARVIVRVNSDEQEQSTKHYHLHELGNSQKLYTDGYYKNIIRIVERKEGKTAIVRLISPEFVVHVDLFKNNIERLSIRLHSTTVANLQGGLCQQTDVIHTTKVETTNHFGNGKAVPIYVLNQDASTFSLPSSAADIISAPEHREVLDTVVVGGGVSGLGSATLISEKQDVSVLLLEKESYLGGLAAGTTTLDANKNFHSRGAGYYSKPFTMQTNIMSRLGIPHWSNYPIFEPIDSYYYAKTDSKTDKQFNAKKYYFEDLWANKTVDRLPASFGMLIWMLRQKEMDKTISNQPIERIYLEREYYERFMDHMTAQEFIMELPCYLEKYYYEESMDLRKRLERESGSFDCKQAEEKDDERMQPVIDMLYLYSRSALGLHPKYINAEALLNFYWSEITTRYTSPLGTKFSVNVMQQKLKSRPNVTIKMNSMVTSIEPMRKRKVYNRANHSGKYSRRHRKALRRDNKINRITYVTKNEQGQAIEHVVYARHVVYASHLGFAPKIIKGFQERRPKQAKMFQNIKYVHYNVYIVTTKGHPFRDTYDLWLRDYKYKPQDPTDIILGRWMELKGYEGFRKFEKDPPGDGILAIYHPLPYAARKTPLNDKQAANWAKYGIKRAIEILQPLATALNPYKDSRSNIEIKSVAVNRWPNSIHWVKKGHFKRALVMRKAFNNIHFAHCTLGTPAFEEAIYRAYSSAMEVLLAMGKIKKPYFSDDGED